MNVYIVIGGIDYEGSRNLRAYSNKEAAEAAVSDLKAHDEKRPPFPDDLNDDAAFDAIDDWSQNHPSGSGGYDSYYIQEMELL